MRITQRPVGSERGFSLVEMLISMAIMMTVVGAIFTIVNPSQGTARVQPELSDMQQRARVGTDILMRDLLMAGAGPYQGTTTGSLLAFFAPVLPYRSGRTNPDPPGTFKDDTITITYVPQTSSQTTITTPMPNESAEIKVQQQNNCPNNDPLCGFEEGMSVLIFDPTDGAWESFEITNVQDQALHLQHRGQQFQKAYDSGSVIVQMEHNTYYWDRPTNRLMHYDGLVTETPVLDNVVGVTFAYFGDPNPPLSPRPTIGQTNCLYDAAGNTRLPVLPANTGSLVELDPAILRDGLPAWCGAGSNQFDPDLFRIRKIQLRLRVQASDPSMRPTASVLASDSRLRTLFAEPGSGGAGVGGYVPDYEVRLEITPRNLNLAR